MINIKNVSKYFDEKLALSDVSFDLKEGEIIALIGENGAGKSTLMKIMCGYIFPSSGIVTIFGNDIHKKRIKALSYIGYVPEISSLYGDMTVYDFLLWISQIWNIKNPNRNILEVSKKMDILSVLKNKNSTLSKGFKKRVEIASAILHKPKFLILDEPTDGLDPIQKEDIRSFIKDYSRDNIVLISTHVLEDADIANRIIMLSKGKVINDSSLSKFKKFSESQNLSDAFRILSHTESEAK